MSKQPLYIILICLLFASCVKVDRISPLISSLQVNDQSSDTIYLVDGDFDVQFEVFDDVLTAGTRIRIYEIANRDSGYFFIQIQNVNKASHVGTASINVPDSVKEDSKYFELTIDAYDDSGNQADQRKSILNFK